MEIMSAVWRSLTHQTTSTPVPAAEAKKLLDAILVSLYEAFQTQARDGRQGHALTAAEIAPIHALCDQLTPAHFQLNVPSPQQQQSPKHHHNRVKYQHIWENELFSMGIFILPPGASIPLHDHPDMSVISRVLYGRLHVTSCDFASPKEADDVLHHSPVSSSDASSPGRRRIARIFQDEVVDAPHTTELLPDRGNLHEFVADDQLGCAIFDILTPPYEPNDGRDCTYYRIAGDVHNADDGRKYVALEEFEPTNFEVVTEPYLGPRASFPSTISPK